MPTAVEPSVAWAPYSAALRKAIFAGADPKAALAEAQATAETGANTAAIDQIAVGLVAATGFAAILGIGISLALKSSIVGALERTEGGLTRFADGECREQVPVVVAQPAARGGLREPAEPGREQQRLADRFDIQSNDDLVAHLAYLPGTNLAN